MNTNDVYAQLERFVDVVREYCDFADFLIDSAGFEPAVRDLLLMDVLKPLHDGVRQIIWRMGIAMAYAQIVFDGGQELATILGMLADTDAETDPDGQFEAIRKAFPLTDPDLIRYLKRVADGEASLIN